MATGWVGVGDKSSGKSHGKLISLPAKLEMLVLDCLQKDPNLRPASAEALRDRLSACDDVAPWAAEEARRWWR